MIEIHNVSKRFYNVVALDNVSLTIPRGEVLGVLGPNGAGKTTLFKIIAGLLKADAGRVQPTERVWPAVAYKPDRLIYPNHLRVGEYLELFGRLSNLSATERTHAAADALARVGLLAAARKRIGELSKGMRQRLGLAQALIGDPPLLLLDEPSNGLDPAGQVEIQQQMRRLQAEGKTIVLSSHQLQEVTAVCTSFIILHQGQVRYENRMQQALALRPQIVIQADADLAAVAPYLRALHPDLAIEGDTLVLGEQQQELRRRVLTLLLGAGYDIRRVEHRRITLEEVYAEAVR